MFSRLNEKIHRLLTSAPRIGGLEISHASLKYLTIKSGKTIQQASLPLPPGIIEQGKVVNSEQLVIALKRLHSQLTPAATPINVVLIVPSSLVYTQAFSVPILPPAEEEEAIDLNLQMISPGKVEESYYDWQEIKKNENAGHVDLLGAFTNATAVDAYTQALTQANFNAVSVEFPGLSLSRLIKERWQNSQNEQHGLLLYLNSEGLLISILKNANLYFSHFTSWTQIISTSAEREIAFADIQSFITQEVQRVLTFYLGRTGHNLENAILISPMFNYEIVQLIEQKTAMKVKNLTITELPNLSPSWFPSLGGALRGLIPRSKDTSLSLAHISAKTEYYQERWISLIALCRNIVVGSFLFVFISYFTVDAVFYRSESTQGSQSMFIGAFIDTAEVQRLRADAEAFNRYVAITGIAKGQEAGWSATLGAIRQSTGTSITLTRIFADKNNLTLIVSGNATNELAAINFKGRVERISNIKNVSLPLSQIRAESTGGASFTLTANLTSL